MPGPDEQVLRHRVVESPVTSLFLPDGTMAVQVLLTAAQVVAGALLAPYQQQEAHEFASLSEMRRVWSAPLELHFLQHLSAAQALAATASDTEPLKLPAQAALDSVPAQGFIEFGLELGHRAFLSSPMNEVQPPIKTCQFLQGGKKISRLLFQDLSASSRQRPKRFNDQTDHGAGGDFRSSSVQ